MVVTRHGPQSEVARAVADWLATGLRRSIEERGNAVLAIPGGRSVAQPLAFLAEEAIRWDRVAVVFVDERHLPDYHEERNDSATAEFTAALLERGLRADVLLRAPFVRDNPEAAAERYWQSVRNLGGAPDVVLLGVGEDGHVASLFPGRPELTAADSRVIAVRDAPKPPPDRLTMTPGLITSAAWACLLFFGRGKRAAYAAYRDADVSRTQCPAKLANGVPNLLVAADAEAAGTGTGG